MACTPQVVRVEAVEPAPHLKGPGTAFSVRARFGAEGVDSACIYRLNWNVIFAGTKTTFASQYPAIPGVSYVNDYTPTEPGEHVINAEVFYQGG